MLTLTLAFSGLVAGMGLAHFIPEEVIPGRKYFSFLKKAAFASLVLVAVFLWEYKFQSWLYLAASGTVLAVNSFLEEKRGGLLGEAVNYGILAVPYFLLQNQAVIASLIFIYGLPAGTLLYEAKKR